MTIIGAVSTQEREISDLALGEPDLSVIIPAFNEERRLPPTLERLHAYLRDQPYGWEIVVVSNGSTDRTEDVVRAAAKRYPNLRLLSTPERGKGIACRLGAVQSRGRAVFLCDADLSMPPDHIGAFLGLLQAADVVAGSREAIGAARYDEPWHRHLMGRVFNRLVQSIIVRGINDTQCGFKAFRREVADDLFGRQTINGFGFDVELIYLAYKFGYRVVELGIDWHFDPDTRVRPGVDTLAMLRELLTIRLRDLRGGYGPVVAPGG